MTRAHSCEDAARRINDAVPGAAVDFDQTAVWVKPESILEAARFPQK